MRIESYEGSDPVTNKQIEYMKNITGTTKKGYLSSSQAIKGNKSELTLRYRELNQFLKWDTESELAKVIFDQKTEKAYKSFTKDRFPDMSREDYDTLMSIFDAMETDLRNYGSEQIINFYDEFKDDIRSGEINLVSLAHDVIKENKGTGATVQDYVKELRRKLEG